jgi:hypothetical protein
LQTAAEVEDKSEKKSKIDPKLWIGVFPVEGSTFFEGGSAWIEPDHEQRILLSAKNWELSSLLEIRLFAKDRLLMRSKMFSLLRT